MLSVLLLVAQLVTTTPSPIASPSIAPSPSVAPSVNIAPSTSPSPSASPAASSTPRAAKPLFVAPRGWHALNASSIKMSGPWTVVAMYGKYNETTGSRIGRFNVIAGPNTGYTLGDVVKININQLHALYGRAPAQSHALSLCNGTSGWMISYDSTAFGRAMHYQQVLAVNSLHTYIATYARRAQDRDSSEAIAALHSLCAPPDDPIGTIAPAPLTAPAGWTPVNLSAAERKALGTAAFWVQPCKRRLLRHSPTTTLKAACNWCWRSGPTTST